MQNTKSLTNNDLTAIENIVDKKINPLKQDIADVRRNLDQGLKKTEEWLRGEIKESEEKIVAELAEFTDMTILPQLEDRAISQTNKEYTASSRLS